MDIRSDVAAVELFPNSAASADLQPFVDIFEESTNRMRNLYMFYFAVNDQHHQVSSVI
jgi:hypothetical protein